MLKRLLYAFLFVLLIGGVGLWYTAKHIRALREAEFSSVADLKKQDIQITIVEGKRREEIAQLLADKGICSATDFLAASLQDEGKLFPDTYRFFPNTPASDVVAVLEANYIKKTAGNPPTPTQLIVASIVEREALNDTDRPIIAGVYFNRIKLGMPLESDPTVQYAKDTLTLATTPLTSMKFWQPITQEEYRSVVSPYNTYLNLLPAGPISNPGLASIQAAEQPASHDYLYFLYDKNDKLQLAKTLQEHVNQE